jgi:ABC-type multidrug transport system fused ATPase/permease subunit
VGQGTFVAEDASAMAPRQREAALDAAIETLVVEAHTLGIPPEEVGWRLQRKLEQFRSCPPRAPEGGLMPVPAVAFENVTRRFGGIVALDRVSFEVDPGSVLGLIGRNGAGKTTALRLALGSLWPDAGRIRTLGLDPQTDGLEVSTERRCWPKSRRSIPG